MKPETKTGRPNTTRILHAGLLACATLCGAGPALAQSAYDCRGLENHAALPAVEGKDGMFFAITPELQGHHGLADETIAMLSDLNAALSARGTTLVLLPVPTRAQVMTDQLPLMAGHLGYNADQSTAVHIDMIRRLTAAGLTVADPLSDLRTAATAGARPFFGTDPRPTTAGTQIMAATVGTVLAQHSDLAGVARGTFTSTAGADVTLPSAMRLQLQTACQSELPAVTTQGFTTSGTAKGSDKLVVLGADITATAGLNLPGFLSEATGLETLGYGVASGGAFAAMSSYLTATDFQVAPPRVLVWEFPVSASMANQGDQPLRELVSAALNTCLREIPVTRAPSGNGLRADLSRLPAGADLTLALDAAGATLPFVRFHFTGNDGLVRTRSIYRHPDQLFTGRFYLPLSGLNASGLRGVEIEGPAAFGLQSRLAACS